MFETSDKTRGGCDPTAAGDPALSLSLSARRAGTDLELFELDLTGLSQDQLLQLQRDEETHLRRHAVIGHRLIGEFTTRGIGFELGAKTTAGLLVQLLRISPREANARVQAAGRFGARRSLTGEILPPVFAATATAQTTGSISPAHAKLIADTILALPAAVAAEHDLAVEATLLEHAATYSPNVLAGLAKRIRQNLDPDGTKPRDEDHTRRRGLTLTTNLDGSGHLKGHLTPECLAITRAWLDSLSAPTPAEDGTRDPRTAAQRIHDALQAAGQRLLASDDALPPCGGTPATLLITITADQHDTASDSGDASQSSSTSNDWRTDFSSSSNTSGGGGSGTYCGSATEPAGRSSGYATTAHGDLISVANAHQLTDQAEVVTVRLNSHGGIVSYGRSRRAASTSQRLALAARDRGCSFPGCTAPPGWTQAHHIRAWQHGGATDLNNMTLVCGHHHRNYEKLGWTCHMQHGLPYWTPPAWIDQGSTTNRNPAATSSTTPNCTTQHTTTPKDQPCPNAIPTPTDGNEQKNHTTSRHSIVR